MISHGYKRQRENLEPAFCNLPYADTPDGAIDLEIRSAGSSSSPFLFP